MKIKLIQNPYKNRLDQGCKHAFIFVSKLEGTKQSKIQHR